MFGGGLMFVGFVFEYAGVSFGSGGVVSANSWFLGLLRCLLFGL